MTPSSPSSVKSGAATTERGPCRSDEARRPPRCGEPIVGEVVAGHDRASPPPIARPVDPAVGRDALAATRAQASRARPRRTRGRSGSARSPAPRDRAGRARRRAAGGRRVDDLHEKIRRVADRGDPRCDLAEGLLGAGAPADLLARLGDRLDQASVLDRDRRLVGERLDERRPPPDRRRRAPASPTWSTPSMPSSPVSGVTISDRMPSRRTASSSRGRARTRVVEVVAC